jgi:hypothetical protein
MPDDTIIPTTDEVVAAVGGIDKMRELVKTVLLYAADDVIGNLREPNPYDGSRTITWRTTAATTCTPP